MDNQTVGVIDYDVRIDIDSVRGQLSALDVKLTEFANRGQSVAEKADAAFNKFAKGSLVAITAASAAIGVGLAKNIGNAVSRFDTLNNAPKVLQNLGNSATEAEAAIATMNAGILGLPTSLDQAVSSLTKISAATGLGAESAAQLSLAFNNMALAGGQGSEAAERALVQFTQALGKGTIPAQEFNTLMDVMPAQMAQVAQSLLGGEANAYQLRDAMAEGKVTMADFSAEIIRLNTQGGTNFASFADQAKDATAGVGTGIQNMNAAITRGITSIMTAIGGGNIQAGIESIGRAFEVALNVVSGFITVMRPVFSFLAPFAVGLSTAAVAFGAIAAAVLVATKAMAAFRVMLTLITAHPIVATLSLILGLIAGIATAVGFDSMVGGADRAAGSADGVAEALKDIGNMSVGAGDGIESMAKKMADFDKQAKKVRDDFRYQLAELVAQKNENIAQLTQTLAEEEAAYQRSYQKRLTDFNKSQLEEQIAHGKTTRHLQAQIDFLARYDNEANRRKLAELQFALAREQSEYDKQATLKKAQYDQDVLDASTAYEAKRAENQTKLTAELDLLKKHRTDVLSVRGVILLDEIEKLKRSRDEQLKSLEQQKVDALSGGKGVGSNFASGFNEQINKMTAGMTQKGATAGGNFWKGYVSGADNTAKNVAQGWNNVKEYGPFALFGGGSLWTWDGISKKWKGTSSPSSGGRAGGGGWSTGGFTGLGGVNEVAGLVHRGEFVLPQSMVDQSTGMPDIGAFMREFGGSQQGGGSSITVNVSGTFATSKQAQREVANQIAGVIAEQQKARGAA